MPNGIESYHEWSTCMTRDQREYEIYRLLKSFDERLSNIERRPLWDKGIAFAGGVLGGFLALLSYVKIFSELK